MLCLYEKCNGGVVLYLSAESFTQVVVVVVGG